MSKFKTKKPFVKKSKEGLSPKLLKTLQNIIDKKSGSVSYIFLQDRVKNIHSAKLKDMEDYQIKSVLHTNLTPQMFEGAKPGTTKTVEEMLELFHSIKYDLGAKYFIID